MWVDRAWAGPLNLSNSTKKLMAALFEIDVVGDASNLLRPPEMPAGADGSGEPRGSAPLPDANDVTSMLEARVLHFARDAPMDMILNFPPTLSSADRMLVECLADAHGLQHRTLGKGRARSVTIWKNTEEATKPSQRRKRGRDPMPSRAVGSKDELMQPWWVQLPLELEDNARDEMARGGGAACARPDSWSEGSLRCGNLVRRGQRRATAAPSSPQMSAPAVPLDESHRGHQLLMRLGWSPGEGLGAPRQHAGALEPLAAYLPMQTSRRGLGS